MTASAAPVALDELAYPDALHAEFCHVASLAGSVCHDIELGGHPIRIEFAGPMLADRCMPALAHLISSDGRRPELTIEAWDRASVGRAAPAPPWDISRYAPREQIRGLDARTLRASYDLGARILALYRPGSERATLYADDAATVPRWVLRTPFRQLFGWWAGGVGMTLVHAAVVARDGAAILLPGRSGSGKSTTALAAAEHGFDFLGDDLCLVDVARGTVHSVYGAAKAEADALERLPALARRVTATEAGQSRVEPPRLVRSARIVGLALPHVTGAAGTSVRPATAADALFALGPSTLVESNGADADSLRLLAELAQTAPVAHVDLGTDMSGVVAAIASLFERWAR